MGQKHPTMQQNSLANEFYFACCNGDTEKVREILPNLSYAEVNYIHPVTGFTPLHVACEYGYHDVVQILLQNNVCDRTIQNRDGNTAYNEATSMDIRSLFHRPCSQGEKNRYIDDFTNSSPFHLITDSEPSSHSPDYWVTGYFSSAETIDSQLMLALSQVSSPIMKFFLKVRTERECREIFQGLIATNISISHTEYQLVQRLYQQFTSKRSIEPLLKIYALDTPLVKALQVNADAFAVLTYLHLQEVSQRAFCGITYRGMNISPSDFEAYKWAHTRAAILQTRIFQSTSKDAIVAYRFGDYPMNNDRLSIIMCFDFTEPCPSAIDLDGISKFHNEREVLLLPFSLFRVASINEIMFEEHPYQKITMKNVIVPPITLWAASRKKRKRKT